MNFIATWFLVYSTNIYSGAVTNVVPMPNLATCERTRDVVIEQHRYRTVARCVQVDVK